MTDRKPGNPDPALGARDDRGQASRERDPAGYGGAGCRQGYGGDYGGGGPGRDFEGSWAQDHGASQAPDDYRQAGEQRGWIDAQADRRSGPYAGRGPKGWSRSDARIREEVCERLMEDRLLDARGVDVAVDDGVVTLTGEVPGASDRPHAEMLARQAPGVREVRNELRYVAAARAVERRQAEPAHYEGRWGRWVPPFIT